MKVMVVIGLIQTLVLIALLWRTEMLNTQIDQLTAQLSQYPLITETQSQQNGAVSPINSSLGQPLTIEQIQFAIRDELQSALAATAISANRLSNDIDVQQTQPAIVTDELKLIEIESQIDYLLLDGEFTQADLISVENELIALNASDRRRILNKMTQSMMAAGVPLSQ